MRHYKLNSERKKDGKGSYIGKCGMTGLAHKFVTLSLEKVSCPDCILALLTDYEDRIITLEGRYEELFPNRPVGERLQ